MQETETYLIHATIFIRIRYTRPMSRVIRKIFYNQLTQTDEQEPKMIN